MYLQLLRPADWVKNVFVFAAFVFGVRLDDPDAKQLALDSLGAFVVFCLAASAGYVLNDILDRNRDRLHPVKKQRPLASGAISVPAALVYFGCLLAAAAIVSVGLGLPTRFLITVGTYLVLTVAYSLALKQAMLLDVIIIAVLFVLRALGGACAIEVPVSDWLLICTFMLCLFLGFGKRRCEIAMIGNNHALRGHRPTLVRYTPELLSHLLSTSGGIAIITFLLYTLWVDPSSPFADRKHNLMYTLPIVAYAIYRYAMLIQLGRATGPTDLIIKDPPFVIAIFAWALAAVLILYGLPAATR